MIGMGDMLPDWPFGLPVRGIMFPLMAEWPKFCAARRPDRSEIGTLIPQLIDREFTGKAGLHVNLGSPAKVWRTRRTKSRRGQPQGVARGGI
jgi:hypothetical protein